MKTQVLETALKALKEELESKPPSPERLNALVNVITAINEIKSWV